MIDDEGKKVLKALVGFTDPASGKDIANASGLDAKVVSNKIKTLKTKGLVDSPARCKYAVTAAGKDELS
ncbi:hypothetical protein CEE37_00415 [candidate division LCP-89 bacterium B3_LCP]|uniref:HTH marR-type domain-containing protein n=1 Tax=candidate division LCP-89 bacterium B3_LCP TaxID=2012998 RepID=A0A532V4P6_UNCL8|nr:MAG: hypothetical protein CEE37_00415 [candidate division LCP-89 bacterium B3_LCP]